MKIYLECLTTGDFKEKTYDNIIDARCDIALIVGDALEAHKICEKQKFSIYVRNPRLKPFKLSWEK